MITMTMEEARELYRSSQCSRFVMARENSPQYERYRELNIPKETEYTWKHERFIEYSLNIKEGAISEPIWQTFFLMSDLVSDSKSVQDANIMYDLIKITKINLSDMERIIVSETINGRGLKIARSGLIYLAYDIGEISLARKYSSLSIELATIDTADMDLLDRANRSVKLCNEIVKELGI